MNMPDELKDLILPQQQKTDAPAWEGPENDGVQGGVTQGVLRSWLTCRERCRLYLVKGLKQSDRFSHKMEYGTMFHLCDEVHATDGDWRQVLTKHCQDLSKRWPFDRDEISKWHDCCLMQFLLYIDFWNKHPDPVKRTSILQEQKFCVPHRLPSGRTVFLRGKMDGVELLHGGQRPGVVLFETKTKGDIDEQQIRRQYSWDLQTLFYLTALQGMQRDSEAGNTDDPLPDCLLNSPIVGVRCNIVKRPLSGGKGNIKQSEGTAGAKCPKCKGVGKFAQPSGQWNYCVKCGGAGRIGGKPPETRAAYMERLSQYVKDEPQNWFMRWDVPITHADIECFRREFLDQVLEMLCDDFEWWAWVKPQHLFDGEERKRRFPHHCVRHFRMPFGVTSPLLDGGETDLDNFLATGSTQGLQHVSALFPELQ